MNNMSTSSTKSQQETAVSPEMKSSTSSIDDSQSLQSPNLEISEAQGTSSSTSSKEACSSSVESPKLQENSEAQGMSSSTSSKEACSSSVESPNLETSEAQGTSSSTSSKEACSGSVESPNLQETSETLGTSSSTSSKEACSSPVESPNLETAQSPETPSSTGKGESSASCSYVGFSETPEMPSSLSDKESLAVVDSTTETSKDGDEIVILSSKTASPSLLSTVYSSIHRVTQQIQCWCDPCIKCCDKCCALHNYLKCSKDAKWNCYKTSIFWLGALSLLVSCFVLTPAVNPFWELLYVSLLLMFCSHLSASTVRGCFAKPPPPIFPKRKRISSPTEAAEKKRKKDTAPVAAQMNPPADENNFVIDVCEDPGAPESNSEGVVSG